MQSGHKDLEKQLESITKIYLIGQNNVGLIFRRTKLFVGQNIRHPRKISSLMSDELAKKH